MFSADDIHTLTDFTQSTREYLERLRETGRPEVLTLDGKAAVVVQDAEAYQKLLDIVYAAESISAVKTSIDSFERGEGVDASSALEELRKRHGVSR